MLSFKKYHGLGNDFVVVDEVLSTSEAVALCDRRFGIGADGVLMVLPSERKQADAKMRVLNADGSEAEMCGNGIRCVAKDLHDSGKAARPILHIETLAGVLACEVQAGPDKTIDTVTVDMGRPEKTRERLEEPLDLGARTLPLTCISMGNPHAVTFVEGTEPLRPLAEQFGPLVERHGWFPQRTNVEFARITHKGEIDLVVWERGCGITLACGTGACATATAAVLTGRAPEGQEITIRLPGGNLGITVAKDSQTVRMRGPARFVFSGECDPEALARQQQR